MYDVIVIGAGPAGCTAAYELAGNGYKVLLLEKFKVPRNKSCSGILIRKSVELFSQYFHADIPASITCEPSDNRGMIFTNDAGTEYQFKQGGCNIWRSAFDCHLAELAARAGARLCDKTTVLSCNEQNETVLVTMKEVSVHSEAARYVICCDGTAGNVSRKIIGQPRRHIITYQTFCEGKIDLDYHYFYAYLQPDLSGYDAWFNVKDGLLVIGTAAPKADGINVFHEKFITYLREHYNLKIDKQIKSEKWLMPQIEPGCPVNYGYGHILLAGEAAGFLNPMGEGISAAMESGYAAARAILTGCNNIQKIHSIYRKECSSLITYMQKQWQFVSGISEKFQYMDTNT